MKKRIKQYNGYISNSDLDGLTCQEINEFLKEKMPTNSILEYSYGNDYYEIVSERDETDEEYKVSLEQENSAKERLEQQEKETLRKLKEKYD